MAYSNAVAAEVRPSNGLDTNGGGFVAGASGTDYTQQNGPQYSVTDGVTAGTTTITSASANFGTDVVGNLIYVAGGTGSVSADRYEVKTRVSSTTITVDRSTGLTAGTGATLHIGGAVQTIAAMATALTNNGVAGNKLFVKGEATITTAATIALSSPATTGVPSNRLIGFTSTRADGGQVTIQLITNTGLTALNVTTNGWIIANFIVDCNSLGTSKGIAFSSNYNQVRNCKVMNFTSSGISSSGSPISILNCELTGGGSAATAAISLGGNKNSVVECNVHDNACPGIVTSTTSTIENNIIANNTGASSDGIATNDSGGNVIRGNTIYGNGRHGFHASNGLAPSLSIKNNLFVSNGASGTGYGLNFSAPAPALASYDGNFYYGNATGARNNADDIAIVPINAVAPYTNALDVTLTASPFLSAGSNDFRLNLTAGGGAAVRGAGSPGALPGSSVSGYRDGGALQHQDTSPGLIPGVISPSIHPAFFE